MAIKTRVFQQWRITTTENGWKLRSIESSQDAF